MSIQKNQTYWRLIMAQAMGYTNGREKLVEYDPLNEELPED